MGTYFVSPTEPSSWRFTPAEFIAALRRRWPEVQIVSDTPDEYQLVEFKLELEHSRMYARLQSGGETAVLDADVRDAATFAVWFRSVVPESIPLIFWDEGYSHDVPVTTSSRAEDLAAVFMCADA